MYNIPMTITDNIKLAKTIETCLIDKLPIRLGINKKNELVRLIFEISQGKGISFQDVIKEADLERLIEEGKSRLFERVKESFKKMRYPSLGEADSPHIMPIKIDPKAHECPVWDFKLNPRTIFIEKEAQSFKWTEKFLKSFPEARIERIGSISEAFKSIRGSNRLDLYNARRENIFLINNKSAFIKKCPCSDGCVRCGYWILNIGFGCPIDCSYCYLQTYSNAPGLILPANIEDYYGHIEAFDKSVKKRTRIGTGEFTDSLALDKYTKYSSRLIPFFKNAKHLIFELKTKASDIDGVLREDAHDNVVISWSMNTRKAASKYEKGGSKISERMDAAKRAAQRGYRIGFHFDPIVYYEGWEGEYKGIIEEMFSHEEIKNNTIWISLGTLRYTPGLKQVAEERFSENLLFYQGEFFLDEDGKLRYPLGLRKDMYNKMAKWIKSFTSSCWIYLCMETNEVWKNSQLNKKVYA